jgi:hypothetical protein
MRARHTRRDLLDEEEQEQVLAEEYEEDVLTKSAPRAAMCEGAHDPALGP